MAKATGSFTVGSWEEETYQELDDGAKLTSASVGQTYEGDLEGDGSARWLMAYRADGTAHFVGLQFVNVTMADRKGSFVLETSGDFDGKVASWKARVVSDSATGDLEGITGTGNFSAPMGHTASFELEYDFA